MRTENNDSHEAHGQFLHRHRAGSLRWNLMASAAEHAFVWVPPMSTPSRMLPMVLPCGWVRRTAEFRARVDGQGALCSLVPVVMVSWGVLRTG